MKMKIKQFFSKNLVGFLIGCFVCGIISVYAVTYFQVWIRYMITVKVVCNRLMSKMLLMNYIIHVFPLSHWW